MIPLIKINIKNSIKKIVEDNSQIPDCFIAESDNLLTGYISLLKKIAKIAPWSYRDSNDIIRSPQESFFGFYAFRNIIRGILISLRFIQSGKLLQENNFFAASVMSYYTASFHLLYSYLALNGRVIIDQVLGPSQIVKNKYGTGVGHSAFKQMPETIIAILTKKNTWKFEPRSRTHKDRWQELEYVLLHMKETPPDFFMSFFKYICFYDREKADKELIRHGIQRLIEVRHASIYQCYGYDYIAHDMLINGELVPGDALGLKTEHYYDFAMALMKFCVAYAIEIKNSIPEDYLCAIQPLLLYGVLTPPFEIGGLSLSDCPELSKNIEDLFCWLVIKKPNFKADRKERWGNR